MTAEVWMNLVQRINRTGRVRATHDFLFAGTTTPRKINSWS